MPYYKEVVEALTDRSIREVTLCKCSRAGGSENLLLNAIRYTVAVNPMPTLYVTGDQISAERFMANRVKRGLKASRDCWSKYRRARDTTYDIEFPDMDFRATWPKAKQAFKQDGWALVLCDEVSTWPEFSADMARKRTDSYPFGHICFISSPDPQQRRASDDDPIFVEFESGDKRYWMMPDPITGNLFKFEMGSPDSSHGLKWDNGAKREDGSWDLERVKATAHYVTPDGSVINTADKRSIVATGRWVATNPNAPSYRRSYHINSFYVPFRSGDFGEIAAAFLTANARGPQALRTFVYEYLAEQWYGEKQTIEANEIEKRKGAYKTGQKASTIPSYAYLGAKRTATLMTMDVQKSGQWYAVREWYDGGDSALIECGFLDRWKDLAAVRAKYATRRDFIDLGYTDRRNEVLEQCIFGEMRGMLPVFGRDSLREPIKRDDRDPFEGTGKAGKKKLITLTFNPNQIKYILARLVDGTDPHHWMIPTDTTADYIRQMTCEECVDGAWLAKHKDNHLWDCEVMQLVGAMALGIFRQTGLDLEQPVDGEPPTAPIPAKTGRKTGVHYTD